VAKWESGAKSECFCLPHIYYLLRLICFARQTNHISLFGLGFVILVALVLAMAKLKMFIFGFGF